jgi:hypothetical protein
VLQNEILIALKDCNKEKYTLDGKKRDFRRVIDWVEDTGASVTRTGDVIQPGCCT